MAVVAVAVLEAEQLDAGADAELVEDVGHVRLDRRRRDQSGRLPVLGMRGWISMS